MKRYIKMAALGIALVLICGLGWFANALLGNPVSKMLATNTAKEHLVEVYPDTDYYIERVNYNFKDGNYYARIKSPSSIDTEFTLYITMLGELKLDTYEDVVNGSNTARRLDTEYRNVVETIFTNSSFPYTLHIDYGTLEIIPSEYINEENSHDVPKYSIPQEELVIDKIYNIQELGARAGHLVIYVDNEVVSFEEAARIMVDIKRIFDEAGVSFKAMDFNLWYPKREDGSREDGRVNVHDFMYEDIYEEGMVERVIEAHNALEEYYAIQDSKK
ncbi:MAG: hypothetical protein IJP28_04710 [Erysipelotrichales bacterium]|nr:hypothetical protein [Erysipelotrichales bacterium]